MENVYQTAIRAQLQLLGELPPELAGHYRELVQDVTQLASAFMRAKKRGDSAALQALGEQAQSFEQRLAELARQFDAVLRAALTTNA